MFAPERQAVGPDGCLPGGVIEFEVAGVELIHDSHYLVCLIGIHKDHVPVVQPSHSQSLLHVVESHLHLCARIRGNLSGQIHTEEA